MTRNSPDFELCWVLIRFIGSIRVREIRINEIRVRDFRGKPGLGLGLD